jgi:hypothetical protein
VITRALLRDLSVNPQVDNGHARYSQAGDITNSIALHQEWQVSGIQISRENGGYVKGCRRNSGLLRKWQLPTKSRRFVPSRLRLAPIDPEGKLVLARGQAWTTRLGIS